MKTVLVLLVTFLTGCSTIQTVADLFAGVDKLSSECRDGVAKLSAKGINVVTAAECDKAAAQAKSELQKVVDRVRAELAKAGL